MRPPLLLGWFPKDVVILQVIASCWVVIQMTSNSWCGSNCGISISTLLIKPRHSPQYTRSLTHKPGHSHPTRVRPIPSYRYRYRYWVSWSYRYWYRYGKNKSFLTDTDTNTEIKHLFSLILIPGVLANITRYKPIPIQLSDYFELIPIPILF